MCSKFSLHVHSAPNLSWSPTGCYKCLINLIEDLPHDLIEDATRAPHVHLEAVVAVGEEALWSSVPARGDVLCVRRLGVHTAARAKVAQLQTVVLQCE